MSRLNVLLPVLLLVVPGCGSDAPATDDEVTSATADAPVTIEGPVVEATSLLGEALLRPELDDEFRAEQEALLAEAQARLDADPDDADALVWVGRRLAYLGRYLEAIDVYSRGMLLHRDDARFQRHRGHRYITVRRFESAVADFLRAAELLEGKAPEVEPDGLPNERNQPTGTTHSSVWYHLGLAHYLSGELDKARLAYRQCLQFSDNPDMLVATSHWLYMTLRRLGLDDEAAEVLEPISAGMDIIENHEYHRLLLMYRGEVDPEELLGDDGVSVATIGYGVGNWYLYNGDSDRAFEIFREVLRGDAWAAFGYLAAEAEVARSGA